MPATGWACRMLWQDGPHAISETYMWNGPTDDPVNVVYPATLNLMKSRTLLMGYGVIPVNFRISLLGAFRNYVNSQPQDVQTMKTGNFVVQTVVSEDLELAGVTATQDGSPDQAAACVLMNFFSTVAVHGRKFLAGVPDVMIREDPEGPWVVGVPSWKAQFDQFTAILTSATLKWCFRARTAPLNAPWKPVQASAYTFNANTSLWGVTCPALGAPVVQGAKIQLRGFKMTSKAYVPANGTFQIDSIVPAADPTQNIYYLRASQSVAGTEVEVLGTVQGVDYSLYPFKTVTPGRQSTHKRGNRSLAAPGRRKVLARVGG